MITERMIDLLATKHDVVRVNVSPPSDRRGAFYHFVRALRVTRAMATLVISSHHRRRAAYIACEGDAGLAYTLALTAIARILGYDIFLHHHSFGYIERPRSLMRWVLKAGGDALTQIFLCQSMADSFCRVYESKCPYEIVSNAAFVPIQNTKRIAHGNDILTLGLLSNLNREKGLHSFIELLNACALEGLPVRGLLAGPLVSPSDENVLAAAQSALQGTMTYYGPLYGKDKDNFFRQIDIFVFPTTYANEAQPTVIYEALATGALIISYDRGCIAAQTQAHGLIIPTNQDFVHTALPFLRGLVADLAVLTTRTAAAHQGFCELHEGARERIAWIFAPLEAQ